MIACESDKASEGTVLLGRRLPSEFFDATLQPTSARQLKTCRPQRTEVWSARWLQLCALGDLWITTPLFRTPMRCQVTFRSRIAWPHVWGAGSPAASPVNDSVVSTLLACSSMERPLRFPPDAHDQTWKTLPVSITPWKSDTARMRVVAGPCRPH